MPTTKQQFLNILPAFMPLSESAIKRLTNDAIKSGDVASLRDALNELGIKHSIPDCAMKPGKLEYFVYNPDKEVCERCESIPELVDWICSGLDIDPPQITTPEEFVRWWATISPEDVFCIRVAD